MDSWRDKDEEDEVEISDFNAGGKGEFIFNSFVDLVYQIIRFNLS